MKHPHRSLTTAAAVVGALAAAVSAAIAWHRRHPSPPAVVVVTAPGTQAQQVQGIEGEEPAPGEEEGGGS